MLHACPTEGVAEVGGTGRYCVYIVVRGGFECPPEFPSRVELDSGVVCGDREHDDASDLPDDVCRHFIEACGDRIDGGPSDGGPIDAGPRDGGPACFAPHDPGNECAPAFPDPVGGPVERADGVGPASDPTRLVAEDEVLPLQCDTDGLFVELVLDPRAYGDSFTCTLVWARLTGPTLGTVETVRDPNRTMLSDGADSSYRLDVRVAGPTDPRPDPTEPVLLEVFTQTDSRYEVFSRTIRLD